MIGMGLLIDSPCGVYSSGGGGFLCRSNVHHRLDPFSPLSSHLSSGLLAPSTFFEATFCPPPVFTLRSQEASRTAWTNRSSALPTALFGLYGYPGYEFCRFRLGIGLWLLRVHKVGHEASPSGSPRRSPGVPSWKVGVGKDATWVDIRLMFIYTHVNITII